MSTQNQPNTTVSASAFDFQRDLGRYWRHVRKTGGLTLTQQGWVYKSNFKALLAALNMADSPNDEAQNGKLWFMRRLLTAMHEFTGNNFDHELQVSPTGKLLNLPMAQRVRWAFETWRDSGAWNELLRLPTPWTGADVRRDSPPALSKARITLLRAISRLMNANDIIEWAPLNLITQLKKNDYQFLFERRHRSAYGGLYTSPYYGPNNPYEITFSAVKDEAHGWEVIEHGFVINLLTGPLHWLGLVDLGYADANALHGENLLPSVYHLTETGAWLLAKGEQPQFIESGGRLIVQPNFAVLALEPIGDSVLAELDQFAESKGGERAMAYELTRESLYRGQRLGWDTARAIQFLETYSDVPVPTNLRRTLEDWESSHRRITFHRNKCIVQFADDDAQTEASAAITALHPHKLGPHFVLVEKHGAGEVVTALRDASWVPTLQLAGDSAGEAIIRVTEEGNVVFTQAAPNVHALGKLAQFAILSPNPTPEGRTSPPEERQKGSVITADSVRAAMSRGMHLDQMMATLAELHHGPVPQALEKKIRAWASFFGTATMRQVTLLELSNFDVLTNLANDAQVGKYLVAIEGALIPLAVVDVTNAEMVTQILVERGIALIRER